MSSSVYLLPSRRPASLAGLPSAWRQLEAEDIRKNLAAFGARKLHQLGFRICCLKRAGDLDGSREHLRIFYRDLVVEDVGIDPRKALYGVQSVAMVRDRAAQGRLVVEVSGIDHQRLALPVADGIPHEQPHARSHVSS